MPGQVGETGLPFVFITHRGLFERRTVMHDELGPRTVARLIFSEVCAFLWPLLGGAGALALLALVVFGVIGGSYGQLALMFYAPAALGLILVAALLRACAKRRGRAPTGRAPRP